MTNDTMEFQKLEQALVRAGREFNFPATPAIVSRVRFDLTQNTPAPNPSASHPWWRVLMPVAIALILAFVLLFAFPNTRDAIGQFLGLRGLQIFYATPTPAASPTTVSAAISATPSPARTITPRPSSTPTVEPFALCCETTLQDAVLRSSFPLLMPPNMTPSKIYYQNIFDTGEQVVMLFGDPENPDFTLYQAHRFIYGKIIGKMMGGATVLAETTINSERAYWFSGAPHVVMFLDPNGRPVYSSRRVVDANTLVWETGELDLGIIYRIETNKSLDDAQAIAVSLVEVSR